VQRRGRAVAGVEIRTLHGLASGVLERCGERRAAGAPLLPVLVSRFARREAALSVSLDPLQDGYAEVVGAVRDLLDAGFEPSHAEALEQLLAERGSGAEEERARALVRTAEAVAMALEERGLGVGAWVLRRATDLLKDDPERALPTRAVLIHGFADATGVATDLIETLLRQREACIYLDQPPDPVEISRTDLGVRFGERFLFRMKGVAEPEDLEGAHSAPEVREMFRATGATAEVREVALRLRRLLDHGVPPEQIGVVVRDLGPYAPALQVQLNRLGVPFSGISAAGSRDAAGRRVAALAELLRLSIETPADAWLSACAARVEFDQRLALQVCGAARLRDVASLGVDAFLDEEGNLPLPVRRGLVEVQIEGEEEGGGRTVAPRRKVAGGRVGRTVKRAAALAGRLERWPTPAPLAEHLAQLRHLLDGDLGWNNETPGASHAGSALARLSRELPGDLDLSRGEFFVLVRRELEEGGQTPLGGAGGGVQVLSVIEARSRTFAHLFVLGLNRDVFPRPVSEDPLLPDRLRLALATLLPDIPVKRTGFDEERFLFAELMSSALRVTLSWLACDDDGKAQPPSPLVERLRLAGDSQEPPLVGAVLAAERRDGPRPAFEHAVLAGVYGTREQFGAVLPLACAEAAGGGTASPATGSLAAARLAVLEELDPDRRTSEGRARSSSLGPYFGFVGAVGEGPDPRRGVLPVTTAEGLAACPWQVFLQKVLRLEPPPDALAAAPGVDRVLLGRAVHRVLERIVRETAPRLPETLEAALAADPAAVAWPEVEALERILQEVCAGLALEAGLGLPGLGRVLAEQARPFLEAAERLAWPDGEIQVLGVELTGTVKVADAAGGVRTLSFRADRLEESEGGLLFTDFKTGTPYSEGKKADTRQRKFLEKVNTGAALQAVAYAGATVGRPAGGRYLFLKPDVEDDHRSFAVTAQEAPFLNAFASVVRTVLQAWDLGSFFPRVEKPDEPEEPSRCSYCEVRQACLRGDSGARRRLARWAARHAREHGAVSPAEGALLAVWRLASKRESGEAAEGEEG
jgi:hypothetical protein